MEHRLTVRTVQELQDAVNNRYVEFLYSQRTESFEIVLAGGTYEGIPLQVVPPAKYVGSLHLRGEGSPPPVLKGCALNLHGQEITLENLIVEGVAAVPALSAHVRSKLTLEGVAFLDNVRGPDLPGGGALVRVEPVRTNTPKRIEIRRSWFIGNIADSPSVLVGWAPRASDPLEELLIQDTAFIGNEYTTILEANGPLTCARCAFFETSQKLRGLVLSTRGETTFRESLLVLPSGNLAFVTQNDKPEVIFSHDRLWSAQGLAALETSDSLLREAPLPPVPLELARARARAGRPVNLDELLPGGTW